MIDPSASARRSIAPEQPSSPPSAACANAVSFGGVWWGAVVACVILLGATSVNPVSAADTFERGDSNTDGLINIADAVTTLEYLFSGGAAYCRDAMDVNDDGGVDISDPINLVGWLFVSGPAPAAPFGVCDADPTGDTLECLSYAPCNLGDAIPGLTQDELDSFLNGRELMSKNFTPEEGLGPLFNSNSCTNCHSTPTVGGSAPIYRNFYLVAVGTPPAQTAPQGIPSMALPSYNLEDGGERPTIPTLAQTGGEPVVAAHRNAPPFFGVGLFEFVSNVTIISLSDPNDLDGDGISGRYNANNSGNIGRFGYKLQANFIEAFIRGAAFNQMGMTTDPVEGSGGIVSYKFQVGAGFDTPTFDNDPVPDPEISVPDFADIIAFNRFVAPPPRLPFSADAQQGQVLFNQLGCTDCHIPEIPSSVGNLSAYTDLLLHDMGPGLADGITQGGGGAEFTVLLPDHLVTGSEFRTQPLWGVRMHGPWLHDGRADSMHDAILWHGGEGQASRDAYDALTPAEQALVIEFLEAL